MTYDAWFEPGYTPEVVLPPTTQQVTQPTNNNFLSEELGKAWGKGARPDTKEGAEYILSYLDKYGRAPSPREVADFKQGLGESGVNLNYLPGSDMGQLGFKTYEDWHNARQFNESFGPYVGEGYGGNVPMGGVVTTDEFGQPYVRYMDTSQGFAQRDIGRGRYIQPPQGITPYQLSQAGLEGAPSGIGAYPQTEGGQIDPSQYYRQPGKPFEPTMEGVLGTFSPVQVYQARLEDFLRAGIERSAPQIQALKDQEADEMAKLEKQRLSGQITQQEYNIQAMGVKEQIQRAIDTSGLMTPEEAQALVEEAQGLIDKGTSAEQLPLFAESQSSEGKSVMGLYNQGVGTSQQQFEQAQPPTFGGYDKPGTPPVETGTEERDYYSLVQGLGLAVEVEQYMMGRYYEFWTQWKNTGPSMPFLDWLQIQMGG